MYNSLKIDKILRSKLAKVFAVGVGPGSPKYVTEIVKEIVENCDVIIGYKYTLKTIETWTKGKEIYEITMNNQEESYQKILPELKDRTLVIPFTGDVNFCLSLIYCTKGSQSTFMYFVGSFTGYFTQSWAIEY